jgi:hypothetical protein
MNSTLKTFFRSVADTGGAPEAMLMIPRSLGVQREYNSACY